MDGHYLEILELPVEEEAVTAVGAAVTHRNITCRIFRIRALIDKVLFFCLFVCFLSCGCLAAGNLLYLNGTSLCFSPAHLLMWYSAVAPKQSYHCVG